MGAATALAIHSFRYNRGCHVLDSDLHYFPDADNPIIVPFSRAFMRMMFAHAELEHQVRDLQGALMNDPTYGDKIRMWTAREQPELMRALVVEKCGSIPEAAKVEE